MPTVRHGQLRSGSVESALARAKLVMLPAEMREHRLVQWILAFDRPEDSKDRNGDRELSNPAQLLLREIGSTFVQPAITFYHSVLMNLGPQWELAEEGQDNVAAILRPENLARSVREFAAFDREHRTLAEASITSFTSGLKEAWGYRIERVQQAWQIWQDEVGQLKAAVNQADESAGFYDRTDGRDLLKLVATARRHSRLSALGFPDDREWNVGTGLTGLGGFAGESRRLMVALRNVLSSCVAILGTLCRMLMSATRSSRSLATTSGGRLIVGKCRRRQTSTFLRS
jgi:hypothetical protein